MSDDTEDLESLQSSTSSALQQSSHDKVKVKEQRKKQRRDVRQAQRIAENPGLAETAKLLFLHYDADENGHMDADELEAMLLDLAENSANDAMD